MCKPRGTDTTSIRSIRPIPENESASAAVPVPRIYERHSRNEIHGHLSLGSLNRAVSLPGRNRVALAEQFEMVNERLHAFLHRGTGWWDELIVVYFDDACGHFVEALEEEN